MALTITYGSKTNPGINLPDGYQNVLPGGSYTAPEARQQGGDYSNPSIGGAVSDRLSTGAPPGEYTKKSTEIEPIPSEPRLQSGVAYSGPSESDYANLTQFSDKQLDDILLYGANAATYDERVRIKEAARAELAKRSPTTTAPTGHGMGPDGGQAGVEVTAPAERPSVSTPYETEYANDPIRIGGPEPNPDGSYAPPGTSNDGLVGSIRDYHGYRPGEYTGAAPDASPGGDPNFSGYSGMDIPETYNIPGYPTAGPQFAGGADISRQQLQMNAGRMDFSNAGEASTREVDVLDTVQGQLKGLLSQDNPLVQQARLRAEQEAASRGLNNSSMALQSGEQAAFASMLPVAQQDAGTYFEQGRANQDWKNQFGQAEQSANIESGLMKQQGEISNQLQTNQGMIEGALADQAGTIESGLAQQNFEQGLAAQDQAFRQESNLSYQDYAEESMLNKEAYDNQFKLNEQQYGQEYALQQLKNQVLVDTASIEAENKLLIQTNAGAAQVYQQYLDSIENLYSNTSQEGATTAKLTAGLADLQRALKENLDTMGAFTELDLSQFVSDEGAATPDVPSIPGRDSRP